jgi:hypothetical protein
LKIHLLATTALIATAPVFAHHSDAGINMETITAFEGTVTAYEWRNPHVYIVIDKINAEGEIVEWEVQMGAVSISTRRGWSPDSLSPGDQVTVRAHAARDGRPYAVLESLEKSGGLILASSFDAPDGTTTTTSIAGKWIADRSSYENYPGGYDGLFRALLNLNDEAKLAEAAFNPLSDENPDASCTGRPTPGALVSTSLYLMEFELNDDTILIRSERFAEERTVFMDGRPHPAAKERFNKGHSIGWWEEDTLIVDTTNFADHRSPYQIGVPSSGRKHVVEKYRLNEAGTHLETEFMLEDPEYLVEPMTHARQLLYSPAMTMFMDDCDAKTSRRFVESATP